MVPGRYATSRPLCYPSRPHEKSPRRHRIGNRSRSRARRGARRGLPVLTDRGRARGRARGGRAVGGASPLASPSLSDDIARRPGRVRLRGVRTTPRLSPSVLSESSLRAPGRSRRARESSLHLAGGESRSFAGRAHGPSGRGAESSAWDSIGFLVLVTALTDRSPAPFCKRPRSSWCSRCSRRDSRRARESRRSCPETASPGRRGRGSPLRRGCPRRSLREE